MIRKVDTKSAEPIRSIRLIIGTPWYSQVIISNFHFEEASIVSSLLSPCMSTMPFVLYLQKVLAGARTQWFHKRLEFKTQIKDFISTTLEAQYKCSDQLTELMWRGTSLLWLRMDC